MRPTSTSIQPFDIIQRSVHKRTGKSMKQPLLRFQRSEQQKNKQIAYGLKDLSAVWNLQQKNTNLVKLKTIIPIINPQSKGLLLWNILVLLAVLFNFFMAPLVVFFTQQAFIFDTQTPTGLTLNAVSIIILYIDLIIRFHISFYRRQKLITSRIQISTYYLKYQFWIDLISVICVTIYMIAGIYKLCYIRLLVYLRFPTLLDVDKCIIHNLTITKYLLSLYKLVRVIVTTWLLTTWAACIYFAIDYYYYQDVGNGYREKGQLWLVNSQVVDGLDIITSFPNWYIWYLYALYWSIQTSATTGYGDITPQNPVQVMYCNIVMLLMTVLFAYYINYVWSIIKQIQSDLQYNQNWHQCRLYLKQLQLPDKDKERIGNFMIQLVTDQKQKQIQEFIVGNISVQLKQEFYVGMRKKFYQVRMFPYLYAIELKQDIWSKLVNSLQQLRIPKNEIIYTQSDQNTYIYYITHGSVKLLLSGYEDKKLGEQLSVDCMFGMYQFLMQRVRCHTAKAQSFVKIWKLCYMDLKQILRQCKQAVIYEQFYFTVQNLFLYKQYQINLYCWKCRTHDHFIPQCPHLCYQRKNSVPKLGVNLQNDYRTQQRSSFNRYHTKGMQNKIRNGMPIGDVVIATDIVKHFQGYYPNYNLAPEE